MEYQGKYLIVAGISKAGTTSLFDYLVDHPQVDGSYIKQTFFFLDKELQDKLSLKAIYDYRSGVEHFNKYFTSKKNGKYRVEATPDYLYSPGTPERLREFLKKRSGKVIFILREPVSRFTSFFFYGKQQGLIPEDMSLEAFYEKSKEYSDDSNPCLMAYKTGFYFEFLQKYIDLFGKGNILVLFFEDMKKDPKIFMKDLATELDIDASFYNSFDFKIKNQTIEVKNRLLSKLYGKVRTWYIDHYYKNKIGILVASILKVTVTKAYKTVNFRRLKKTELDLNIIQKLEQDYKEEILKLEALINVKTPW